MICPNIEYQFGKYPNEHIEGRKNSKFYKPSVVSELRITELPGNGIKYQSDISLLFNQQRLVKVLGTDTFNDWLKGLTPKDVGIDTSKYTDAQLLSFIKSRNIQSPAELRSWSEYLNSEADKVISEYNALVSREQARIQAAQQASQAVQQIVQQNKPE